MTSHPSNAGQVPPLRPKIESQSTPPIFRLDQYRYCYDLNQPSQKFTINDSY